VIYRKELRKKTNTKKRRRRRMKKERKEVKKNGHPRPILAQIIRAMRPRVLSILFILVWSRKTFLCSACQIITQSGRYHGCSVDSPFGVTKYRMKKNHMRNTKSRHNVLGVFGTLLQPSMLYNFFYWKAKGKKERKKEKKKEQGHQKKVKRGRENKKG